MRQLVVVLCSLALFAASAEEPPPLAARIDAYLAPYLERGELSGNLLIERDGQVVYERSFGQAHRELEVPNRAETRFNVASITKPMTVIALIGLVTDEKLSLDDPLSKWIPDFPRGDEITIGHLARHRAGIPHRVTEPDEETVPRSAAEMVAFAARKPLTGEPGEAYNYSSGGFSVLARVLELASGKDYDALLRHYVFEPAGMASSAHVDARELLPNRAAGYVADGAGSAVNARLRDLSYLVGAGSVWSTTGDLMAMLHGVRDGLFGEGPQQSFVDETGIDWNGVTGGYRAFADWHRASKVSVVFVANLQSGAANRLRRDLPKIVAGEAVPTPVLDRAKPIAVDRSILAGFEGVYELRPGSPLRVRVVGNRLQVNDWLLLPIGERRFFCPQDYAIVEVVVDEAGRPTALDWKIGDQSYPCPRIGDLES